jgi:hypothetical protein
MARVVHAVDVEITGELDPSLAKAIGMTDAELKRLQSAAKTFNSLMAKMSPEVSRGMDEVAKHVEKAESTFSKMSKSAQHSFHQVAESAARAGESIKKAFEPFHRGLEKIGEFSGITGILGGIGGAIAAEEFARGAFETRAEREVLQNQLRSMTESMGRAGLDKDIDMMIRGMEGKETPVRYDELMKTSTLLMGADRNRFQNVEQVHKMLSQIADISRSPEAFGLASASITKMLAEGTVDAAHLRELSIDTGFQFREGMAKALHVTPEQMTEMMKKHKFSGQQLIDALLKSIDEATGPGGPAHGHALAQLQGLSGIQERFLGHWKDFQESFGVQLENFLTPIADRVFNLLTPAALTHAFDQLSGFTKAWGAAIGETVRKLDSSGVIDKLKTIGSTIFGGMGANFDKFFETAYAPGIGKITELTAAAREWIDKTSGAFIENIKKTLDAIQTTVSFIHNNFELIKNSIIAAATAWAAVKVWDIGAKFAEIFKAIGGAVFNVGTATINVATGVETGGAAGGGVPGTVMSGLGRAGIATGMVFGQANIAENQRPLEMAWLQKFGLSVENATRVLDAAWARIPGLDGQFGGLGTAINDSIRALAHMATIILALPFAGIGTAIGQLESAVSAAASGVSAHEAAVATLPKGPGAPVPSGPPAPHAKGGIVIRPHVGLVGEAGPEAIIPLKKGGGGMLGGVTVNAPITINGPVADQGNLAEILTEHAREIARQVKRALEIEYEQEAVV